MRMETARTPSSHRLPVRPTPPKFPTPKAPRMKADPRPPKAAMRMAHPAAGAAGAGAARAVVEVAKERRVDIPPTQDTATQEVEEEAVVGIVGVVGIVDVAGMEEVVGAKAHTPRARRSRPLPSPSASSTPPAESSRRASGPDCPRSDAACTPVLLTSDV
jgi:hypothetical protein